MTLPFNKGIKFEPKKKLLLSANNSLFKSKDPEVTQNPLFQNQSTPKSGRNNERSTLLESNHKIRTLKHKTTRIEQLVEHNQRAMRRLKTHNWLLGEPNVLAFFEVRHRGIELWKIARNHFQSKSKKTPQEALEEELQHKGSEVSKLKKSFWTIHPDSFPKFIIYFLKLLSLIYNFFYLQVM